MCVKNKVSETFEMCRVFHFFGKKICEVQFAGDMFYIYQTIIDAFANGVLANGDVT